MRDVETVRCGRAQRLRSAAVETEQRIVRFLTRSAASNGAGELPGSLTAQKLPMIGGEGVNLLRIAIGLQERADATDCDDRPRLRASTLYRLLA